MLTKGFFVRNFSAGSPGKGKGSEACGSADKIAESKNGAPVVTEMSLEYNGGEGNPFDREMVTGVNHANGLSRFVQVGECESFSS